MKQPVTQWLQERGYEVGYELMIAGYADVIGFEFAERVGRPVPKLERVIVIELKLRDVKGVFYQARTNKYHVGESWAAMPEDYCEHMPPVWLDRFREKGIGLLSVGDSVNIIFPPVGGNCSGIAFRRGLDKKLWRVHKMNEKKERQEMSDPVYQVYLDSVKEYLEAKEARLLTDKEEEIVINHLEGVTLSFCNNPEGYLQQVYGKVLGRKVYGRKGTVDGLNITEVLSIETAKKVSEIHPDFPTPSEEQVKQRVEEVLAVQNYLEEEDK